MTKNKSQSFVQGALILAVATGIVKIIGAIYKIPITGILTGTGMGYYSIAYNIFNVIYTLATAGLPIAVSKMVSENVAKGNYKEARKIFKLSSVLFTAAGVLGFLITFFGANLFAGMVSNTNASFAIMAISPAILFGCLMSSYRGYYQGLKNMVPTAVSEVIEALVKLGAGLLFAYFVIEYANDQFASGGMVFGVLCETIEIAGKTAMPYAAAASILGVSLSTFVGFIFLFFRHKLKGDGITVAQIKISPKTHHSIYIIKKLVRIAIPVCIGAIAFNITSLIDVTSIMSRLITTIETDPVTIINMCGAENLVAKGIDIANLTASVREEIANYIYGSYQYTMSLFNLVPAITITFGMSVLPTISSGWALKDFKSVRNNINILLRMCALIAIPAGIGLSMMSAPVLNLLYGAGKGELAIAAPILTITAITAIFLAVVTPLYSVLQGIGRADIPVIFMVIGGILKVAINYVLVGIPGINIYGAAIGTFVCYFFIFVASLLALCKITKTKPEVKSVLIKPLIAGICCGTTALLIYNIVSIFSTNKFVTIISIALGGVAYIVALLLLRALKKTDVLLLPKGEKIAKIMGKHNLLS